MTEGYLGSLFPQLAVASLGSGVLPCGSKKEGREQASLWQRWEEEVLTPWQEKEAGGPAGRLTHPHTHWAQGWVYHLLAGGRQTRGNGRRGRGTCCAVL